MPKIRCNGPVGSRQGAEERSGAPPKTRCGPGRIAMVACPRAATPARRGRLPQRQQKRQSQHKREYRRRVKPTGHSGTRASKGAKMASAGQPQPSGTFGQDWPSADPSRSRANTARPARPKAQARRPRQGPACHHQRRERQGARRTQGQSDTRPGGKAEAPRGTTDGLARGRQHPQAVAAAVGRAPATTRRAANR